MSSTKNTAKSNVSNNKIIINNDFWFSYIEFQLDIKAIGIIPVVNKLGRESLG